MALFVTWFYRARVNADGRGWPQRHTKGWAIGAWFVPVLNLYVPFQIMADIWRAGLPDQDRANQATWPRAWWASMLAFFLVPAFTTGSANQDGHVGIPAEITGVLAATMTALLVQKVSSGPLGRKSPGEGVGEPDL
jgi:hypothetical protein